ncbi:hypothetical protein BH11ACT8_BH11ACT8_23210 [soil metagenome]
MDGWLCPDSGKVGRITDVARPVLMVRHGLLFDLAVSLGDVIRD